MFHQWWTTIGRFHTCELAFPDHISWLFLTLDLLCSYVVYPILNAFNRVYDRNRDGYITRRGEYYIRVFTTYMMFFNTVENYFFVQTLKCRFHFIVQEDLIYKDGNLFRVFIFRSSPCQSSPYRWSN